MICDLCAQKREEAKKLAPDDFIAAERMTESRKRAL
jgi:hypothetical protein